MHVAGILQSKGSFVATIRPSSTLHDLSVQLDEHGVGALVVSTDGAHVEGIVSERDVARSIGRHGSDALDLPVSEIMSTDIRTCEPTDTVDSLMATMTRERVRHVPVVVDGQLAGIVSIGDVVKNRVDELQEENGVLHEYLYSGR